MAVQKKKADKRVQLGTTIPVALSDDLKNLSADTGWQIGRIVENALVAYLPRARREYDALVDSLDNHEKRKAGR